MSAQAVTGAFQKSTSTGNQAVTGLGFRPVAVLFASSGQTADGVTDGVMEMLGWTDGTRQGTRAISVTDATLLIAEAGQSHSNAHCCRFVSGATPSIQDEASIVSLDADGFTVNWTTSSANARIIHYLAIGGGAEAFCGTFIEGSGTSDPIAQSVSGVGFRPDLVLFFGGSAGTTTLDESRIGAEWSFGAMNTTGQQWAQASTYLDGANTSGYAQRTNKCLVLFGDNVSGTREEAQFVSMDADGFSISWTGGSNTATQQPIFYLALSNVLSALGSTTQPTANGTASVSGMSLTPEAVLLCSMNQPTTGTSGTPGRRSFGLGDGTTEGAIWRGVEHGGGTNYKTARATLSTKVIRLATEAATGSSSTTNAEADLQSLDISGFTLNWTTTDATAREILFLALGVTPAAAPSYVVEVEAIERDPLLETFNIQMPVNGIGTMRADFESEGSPIFRPSLDDEITVTEYGVRIFGGYITAIRERGFDGPNGTAIVVETTSSDYRVLANRRYVNETISAGSPPVSPPTLVLKDILEVIVERYLAIYGVTLDFAQVDGPTMDPVTYEYRLVKDVLDELSTITGYAWDIDVNKVLRMYQVGTRAAPFNVHENDLPARYFGDVTVEPTREQYANRVLLQAGPNGSEMVTNTFVGDGVTDTFSLTNEPMQWWVVVVNGTTYETIGTSPAYWSIDLVARTITREAGPPALNDDISITYIGRFPITIVAEDAGEIAAHGLVELVVPAVDTTDLVLAQSLADAELVKHLAVLRRITYSTRERGLHPGQTQDIVLSDRNLNTTGFLAEVMTESEPGGDVLVRRVTVVEGSVVQGDWRDLYRQWL